MNRLGYSITNIDSLLSYIYTNYIQLREDDFKLHYKVFDVISQQLRKKMKEVDKFYEYYSSTVQAMGSHYDRLRIKKPDEFDIFNVMKLPSEVVNSPDFVIKGKEAAFLYIVLGENCQRILKSGPNAERYKKILNWTDDYGYLRRSLFFNWFKSVVSRALNKYKSKSGEPALFMVDGIQYAVTLSESGPAITLVIESLYGPFRMDVDFVPALKLPEELWPPSPDYKEIPVRCRKGYRMVVAKPNKYKKKGKGMERSWRAAMPAHERELMYGSYNLRQAIKLIKKLRDTMGMNSIASYFIKQLAFEEIDARNDPKFGTNSPATLFKVLVNKLYLAIKKHRIPYYWNNKNNLLERIDFSTLKIYEHTLKKLVDILECPNDYMKVARYLLTADEFKNDIFFKSLGRY